MMDGSHSLDVIKTLIIPKLLDTTVRVIFTVSWIDFDVDSVLELIRKLGGGLTFRAFKFLNRY